ncbi:MAG: NAD(P)/FAD-dependent oxidoreductase, partial [Candidatus Electrothrix sp. EH2]|nr:NAD(P)/FAD-dependent oxidoreductase [Candidatus Electrothrix sp. EH2]
YTFKTVGSFLDQEISNNDLKIILCSNIFFYHDDPYSMSMIYFGIPQSSYFNGGSHYIHGGSQKLSDSLGWIIKKNGGDIKLNNFVTEIIIEKNKAVGIKYINKLDKGETQHTAYSKRIIANNAIPNIPSMLKKGDRKRVLLKKKNKNMIKPCSLISIYIGLKKEPKELMNKNYSTFLLGDNISKISHIRKNSRDDFSERSFFFIDYSQIDSGLTPKGRSVGTISTVDYFADWERLTEDEYRKKKDEVAHTLFKRLEQLIPGITDEIECYEVGTPKTIQKYTCNPEGIVYGFAQIPRQAGIFRLPNKSPVKNLYFASAWTNPGGGFTGAIFSGWFCAHEVTNSLKPLFFSGSNYLKNLKKRKDG